MIENLKRQILPILLGTVIVSAILSMYNTNIILCILSFLSQAFLFLYFNKVRYQEKNQVVSYLIGLLIVAAVTFVGISTYGGMNRFFEWCFVVQPKETIVLSNLIVCFLCLNFFIASCIYYFTQVIYRSVFVFMVILIPFALYGKRFELISYVYIALIIGLYIAVMIHCRQMIREKTVTVINDSSYKRSIFIFVVLIITIALLIPKPTFAPLRDGVSERLGSIHIGNREMGKTGAFSSMSDAGSKQVDNDVIYKVNASENLYLRHQTFDLYQESNWVSAPKYSNECYLNLYQENENQNFNLFMDMIRSIASKDKDFAKKYSIGEYKELKNNKKNAVITLNHYKSYVMLGLNNMYNSEGIEYGTKIYGTRNFDFFLGDNKYIHSNDSYTVYYYSEVIDRENDSIIFAKRFNQSSYTELFQDLKNYYIQNQDIGTVAQIKVFKSYFETAKNAYQYYMDTYQEPPAKVKALAEQLTVGLSSDYDKAKAIELYFKNGGYVYDLEYEPKEGNEGIEYFIFESKKGSCSNYATAMTLMARAVGLPSRYVSGFLMNEKEDDSTYVVRGTDAHAFTEVFIAGYGWMTFDATVSDFNGKKGEVKEKIAFSRDDIYNIVIGCIAMFLFVICFLLLFPFIKESSFRMQLKVKNNKEAILLIYQHMKKRVDKKLAIETTTLTAKMVEITIKQVYGVDMAPLTKAYDKACYGDKVLTNEEIVDSYQAYLAFYQASKTNSLFSLIG